MAGSAAGVVVVLVVGLFSREGETGDKGKGTGEGLGSIRRRFVRSSICSDEDGVELVIERGRRSCMYNKELVWRGIRILCGQGNRKVPESLRRGPRCGRLARCNDDTVMLLQGNYGEKSHKAQLEVVNQEVSFTLPKPGTPTAITAS